MPRGGGVIGVRGGGLIGVHMWWVAGVRCGGWLGQGVVGGGGSWGLGVVQELVDRGGGVIGVRGGGLVHST